MALERDYVKGIRRMLETKYPGFYFKSHGGPYQIAGLPDLVGCHKGIFIGIEVKQPGKEDTLKPVQKLRIRQIRNAGGIAFMATTAEQADLLMRKELKRVEAIQASEEGSPKSTKK